MKFPILSLLALSLSQICAQTVFWDDKANGQLLFDCSPGVAGGEQFASNNNLWRQSGSIASNPCFDSPPVARPLDLSNWSTLVAPDSPNVDVVLAGSSPITSLLANIDVSTLTIAETNELSTGPFGQLNVFGGMIHNDGQISLDGSGFSTSLKLNADASLTGSGTVLFRTSGNNTITSSDPSHTLTIGENQKLLTSAVTTSSPNLGSRIVTALKNEGRITANGGVLRLDTHPKTNTSTIEAINGGTIALSDVAVNNTGGVLRADTDSFFEMDRATLTGGVLQGPGQFSLPNVRASFNGPLEIGSDATVIVESFNNLSLTGTLTNEGLIRISGSGFSAKLEASGDVTLLGTGRILFDRSGNSWITSSDPSDVLTIGPDQIVTTSADTEINNGSRFSASFVNNGTINADVGDLQLDSNDKTNNNLIQATGGAELRINLVTIENTAGRIRADQDSTIGLLRATINGGRLEGAGEFDVNLSATLNGPLSIDSETSVVAEAFDDLFLAGTFTNEGLIRLSGSGFSGELEIVGDTTLLGAGRILFDGGLNTQINSSDPGHVLTIGPDQLVTTSASAQNTGHRVTAALVNNGTITTDVDSLQLDTNPKTNNGTFRAAKGATLSVQSADTLLTNYDAATGTLTGGRYEAIGDGSTLILQNADVTEIAAGTEVVIGAGATIPALESLETLNGNLSLLGGATLSVDQSLAVGGRLEVGLSDGNVDGFDATSLAVDGDLDLTGATLDVSDLGATDGSYQIFTATGTVTGTPTLGNLPERLGASIVVNGGVVMVTIITAPEIVSQRAAQTGVVSIHYQSINGVVFRVVGGADLSLGEMLPDTAVGNGSVMTYTHTPAASAQRYFYRLIRD